MTDMTEGAYYWVKMKPHSDEPPPWFALKYSCGLLHNGYIKIKPDSDQIEELGMRILTPDETKKPTVQITDLIKRIPEHLEHLIGPNEILIMPLPGTLGHPVVSPVKCSNCAISFTPGAPSNYCCPRNDCPTQPRVIS